MGQRVSRRSILKAAGVGGIGLAGAGATGRAVAMYQGGGPSAADLARLPRVPGHVRPTDGRPSVRNGSCRLRPAPAVRMVESLSPGEGLSHLGVDLRRSALEFICDRGPNVRDRGDTVDLRGPEVAWQPGGGMAGVPTVPCIRPAIGMRYAGVPRHQVVLLDDRAVYVGNSGASG